MKRTAKQNAIIHKLKTANGISDENYRALIARLSNARTETSAELSSDEANALIQALGGTPPAKRRGGRSQSRNLTKLATSAQRNKIYALAVRRWGVDKADATLAAFAKGQIGKANPHTTQEASRLIQTLLAMNTREGK